MKSLHSLGFTLVEVMLAMAITAFVAVLAYQGISTAITAAEQQEQQAGRLADVQRALILLARDIEHSIPRSITDAYGERQPAMLGGVLYGDTLTLSRRGWINPQGQRRSELQRVRYVLEDQQLWRENYLVMDRVSEEEDLQRVLLINDVTAFDVTFLQSTAVNAGPLGGEWVNSWGWEASDSLPLAVTVRLTITGVGDIERVLEVL